MGFVFTIFLLIFLCAPVFAQEYQPLSPLPGSEISTDKPAEFFNLLFIITIAVAAVLAVLMFAVGGLQYMGSDAWSTKEDARRRMFFAVGGLLLLLFSVLLLSVINPNLVSLEFFADIKKSIQPKP